MDEKELLVEIRDDIALFTLNRPESRNALSTSLLVSLALKLEEMERSGDVRAVIIKGAGDRAFSAGIDLTEMPGGLPEELLERIESKGPLQYTLGIMEASGLPVVAMIRGYALGGGCELSMACDLRVGSEDCLMGMPPARLGIVYPPEGLARFVRNVGLSVTKEVFLTARYFNGAEALRRGLLHFAVPDDVLDKFTLELAREVASRAPLSVAGLKKTLNLISRRVPLGEEEQARVDAMMAAALSSEDAVEAMAAFREKREPDFKGK